MEAVPPSVTAKSAPFVIGSLALLHAIGGTRFVADCTEKLLVAAKGQLRSAALPEWVILRFVANAWLAMIMRDATMSVLDRCVFIWSALLMYLLPWNFTAD